MPLHARLLEDLRFVVVLEFDFLQKYFHRILRLESLRDKFSYPLGEALFWRFQSGQVAFASVFTEFSRCQAIIGGFRLWVGEKSRKRIIPFTE